MIYEGVFFSFDVVLCLVAVLIVPGGFKGGWRFIVLRFLPPWAELADPSPAFEKRGARAGDLSPWLDPRPPDLWVLAGEAEILARAPPPLPFGTQVPDCSLAGELVAAFFAEEDCWCPLQNYTHWKLFYCSLWAFLFRFHYHLKLQIESRLSIRDCGFIFLFWSSLWWGGVSSEEGASRGTGFSEVISSNVSIPIRQ